MVSSIAKPGFFMPNSAYIPSEKAIQFVIDMKRSKKILFLALFCMLSSQMTAAFATVVPLKNVEQSAVTAHHHDHSHGHEAMHGDNQGDKHGEDCLDPVTTGDQHQSMDCEESCMGCLNHCSSVGIISEQSSDKFLSHRSASASDKDASFRIDNPFRPPIAA